MTGKWKCATCRDTGVRARPIGPCGCSAGEAIYLARQDAMDERPKPSFSELRRRVLQREAFERGAWFAVALMATPTVTEMIQ